MSLPLQPKSGKPSFLRHPRQGYYNELCAQAIHWESEDLPVWALILYRAALELLGEIYDETGPGISPRVSSLINKHVDGLVNNISRLEKIVLREED